MNKQITPLKEKLKIAARVAFAIGLLVGIIWEFIQPHENKFRSIARIVLWLIFLIMQLDHLYKKFRGVKTAGDL